MVRPGGRYTTVERGVYNLLVWSGTGTYGGQPVTGGDAQMDELLVVHDAATRPLVVENTGGDDLVVLLFFGPDVNPNVPTNPLWKV